MLRNMSTQENTFDSHEYWEARHKFDSHEYWEARHKAYGNDLRSVGNKTISSEANERQLVEKSVLLAYLFGHLGIGRNARFLDAGCGQGLLTRCFAELGFDCVGVDVSASAINNAVTHQRVRYLCAALETFRSDCDFDVVVCADVLYHIVDDQVWAATLINLVGQLNDRGYLCVVEYLNDEPSKSPHCRWRTRCDYVALCEATGNRITQCHPFTESQTGQQKTVLFLQKDS